MVELIRSATTIFITVLLVGISFAVFVLANLQAAVCTFLSAQTPGACP